jgi:regulator of sigma E protease
MQFMHVAAVAGIVSGVVLVHEAGHFLAARKCGVPICEFAIGLPGTPILLIYWRHKETAFTVRALPFGGFIQFGTAESTQDGPVDDTALARHDGRFEELSPHQKAAILVAGSLANLVAGATLMVAATMGLKGLGMVDAVASVLDVMAMMARETVHTLVHLHLGGIVGPVGAAGFVHQAMVKGAWQLVGIVGIMSCSVGATNLLPVPGFDGWHIAMTGVEAMRGRRLSWQFQAVANLAGYTGILALLVATTYHDVIRLLRGAS